MSRSYLVSPSADPVAGIPPMRFVYIDPSNQYTVLVAASATAHPLVGISQAGTRTYPSNATDANVAGLPGENLLVFNDPEDQDCQVESGGVINPGDFLTSDTIGRAIATTTTGNQIGAQADGAATAAGQFIPVTPNRFIL
jgi:hypothetical protein